MNPVDILNPLPYPPNPARPVGEITRVCAYDVPLEGQADGAVVRGGGRRAFGTRLNALAHGWNQSQPRPISPAGTLGMLSRMNIRTGHLA